MRSDTKNILTSNEGREFQEKQIHVEEPRAFYKPREKATR